MVSDRRTLLFALEVALLGLGVTHARPALAADPMAECIAENERSLDLRKQGKLLDARRELAACSAASCPEAIQQACRGRIGDLNAAIPSIVFDVRDAAGQDRLDVQLAIDGQPSGTVGFSARQVDPGRHVFRFEAAGRPAVEKTVILREGEKDRREAVVLDPNASSRSAAPGVPAGASSPDVPAPSAREDGASPPAGPATSSSSLRTAGWVAGGSGLVAMAVGVALGFVARSSYDDAAGCAGTTCATREGLDARSAARATGNVATVVFVAGAAAVAVGIVLWIAAPSAHAASATAPWRVGLTAGGAIAEGRF